MLGFLVFCVLTLAGVAYWINTLSQQVAEDEALADAERVTEVLAQAIETQIPRGLVSQDIWAGDQFQTRADAILQVEGGALVGDLRRVKIWSSEGRVIWSDENEYIGDMHALSASDLRTLRTGQSAHDFTETLEHETRYEDFSHGGLVEVYTQIWSPEGQRLLFEVYFPVSAIEARQNDVVQGFRDISLGGLLVMVGGATPMLWVLTRRVAKGAAERQRLLESAISASEAERRRIARDLHDGVVQDLAGTAFSISALARSESDEGRRETLERSAASLREGLRGLRSLMVEIHPPDLKVQGLAVALEDLIAPAAGVGVHASLRVDDVDGVPEEVIALVWRVAQEAVRNTVRHAHASELGVSVCRENGHVVLEVSDDGVGFRPSDEGVPTSFGLRGLSGLVRDYGGRVEVRSLPGAGTTVRMEVGAR